MPSVFQVVASTGTISVADTGSPQNKKSPTVSSDIPVSEAEDSTVLITQTLGDSFVSLLPLDPRIERVYWAFEGPVLRIWTIIDQPDFSLESPIYDAQLKFMDKFPELECDFSVNYRFGKTLEEVKAHQSNEITPSSNA